MSVTTSDGRMVVQSRGDFVRDAKKRLTSGVRKRTKLIRLKALAAAILHQAGFDATEVGQLLHVTPRHVSRQRESVVRELSKHYQGELPDCVKAPSQDAIGFL